MPKPALLEGWAAEVSPEFRFVLKASQRITHFKRLKEAGAEVEYFFRVAATLGDRLGPALFQLPPNLKKDLPRLEAFLATLPAGARAAFEFRHASWFEDDVFAALRGAGRGALHRRGRGARDAARRHGATGATCACAGRTTTTPPSRAWAEKVRGQPGARPTSSSSTRTPARGRASRESSCGGSHERNAWTAGT